MRYSSNPISQSRQEYLKKFIFSQLIQSSITNFDQYDNPTQRMRVIKKSKVGPYKLILWEDIPEHPDRMNETPYVMSGHEIIRLHHNDPTKLENHWEQYILQANKLIADSQKKTLELLSKIAEADPTESGEYSLWIAKQIFKGNIHISVVDDEDVVKVQEDLNSFALLKKRNLLPTELRDINNFPTYADFFKTLKEYGGAISDREALALALEKSEIAYQSDRWQVVKIKSWQLARRLAKGTAWCVRGTDAAKMYLEKPEKYPLLLFIKDGEKFGLLTNLPGHEQFMDPNDSRVKQKTIEEDHELQELVEKFSTWIYCSECQRFYWGERENTDIESTTIYGMLHRLRNERDFELIANYLGGAALIAEIPSSHVIEEIVGKPEIFADKIVIGSSRQILSIQDAQLPDLDKFAEKAGYDARTYASALLNPETCDICHGINDQEYTLANVQHALYVLKRCEDYPSCGHEPLPNGAPGCPPMTIDGKQVGMRCICGAFVPLGSSSSLCPACLNAPDPEYRDFPGDYEDYYEEDEPMYNFEMGCPVEDVSGEINTLVTQWEKYIEIPWATRDNKNQFVVGPNWFIFEELINHLNEYSRYFASPVKKLLTTKQFRALTKIQEQGWFDRLTIKTFLPFFQKLKLLIDDNYAKDHKNCCQEDV